MNTSNTKQEIMEVLCKSEEDTEQFHTREKLARHLLLINTINIAEDNTALQALTELLISKGVISTSELVDAINKKITKANALQTNKLMADIEKTYGFTNF